MGPNQLSGGLPASLANLTSLQVLILGRNPLAVVPLSDVPFGSWPDLRTFSLFENGVTGEIPSAIGSLSNLQVLSLAGNSLTGSVPDELGNLFNLISSFPE